MYYSRTATVTILDLFFCPTVLLRLVWVGWQTSVRTLPRALDDLPPHLRQGSAFVGSREPRWHTWRRQCMAEAANVPFGPSVGYKLRQGLQPPIAPRSCPCKSSHLKKGRESLIMSLVYADPIKRIKNTIETSSECVLLINAPQRKSRTNKPGADFHPYLKFDR